MADFCPTLPLERGKRRERGSAFAEGWIIRFWFRKMACLGFPSKAQQVWLKLILSTTNGVFGPKKASNKS
jgi:hypothetical protein